MAKKPNATTPCLEDEPLSLSNGTKYGSIPLSNASQNADNKPPKRHRALAPDLLRGLLNLLMSFDHISLALRIFPHGTGLVSEDDGQVVHGFNDAQPYILRTLTHLCGPGFTFLMGMGVVYLVESRDWSDGRMVRYLARRMGVLTALPVFMGVVGTVGRIWLFNMVLFALAVDYFLAGVLLLVMRRTEKIMARVIEEVVFMKGIGRDEETWAKDTSRRIHNAFLLIFSILLIWSNQWLSPGYGYCLPENYEPPPRSIFGYTIAHPWLQMWFWPVNNPEAHIISAFPPFAWLSFSTIGLLYGRYLSAKPRSRTTLVKGYALVAVGLATFFVFTRLAQVGNLSENCLQTPEHADHFWDNQYLVSWKSFFYIVKYVPDVAFWSFTMAGNFILLAIFDSIPLHIAKRISLLTDLGKSALFYYVVHLFIIFPAGDLLVPLFGEDTDMEAPMNPGVPQKGIKSMKVFWLVWVLLNLALWPICRWFSKFKLGKPADSVWRMF